MPHFHGHSHTKLEHRYRTTVDRAGRNDAGGQGGKAAPTHDQIAKLAYSYWETRGRQHGSAVEDWLRAERELKNRSL
jgi:hypothetical protein